MAALQTLMEMGFSENAVKKALSVTGGGVEQAMEWLLAHADDPGINDPPAEKKLEGAVGTASGGEASGTGDAAPAEESCEEKSQEEAKSIKCDDCGKLFKSSEEVEFHAVKSGHTSFSESTEEKKPLTEEEKLQKKKNLEEKIKQRRLEREEKEAKEALEREKKRIQMGQEIAERKRVMQEQEMKRLAEERKREKLEDKMARQRVKEQIERDRQARKEKEGGSQAAAASEPKPQPAAAAQPAPKKDYSQTRLQIRFPSGTPLVQEFKAKEPLSAVRLWVSLNRPDGAPPDTPFNLSTTFPRKIFSDEDMDKPLEVLGLVPSAVLIVAK
ncbi:UBX domain-containing protein 1-B-like [Eriocheir sinensis]|uniref:UBX domain-containing protein 1-B-like n=1 Tax=Eriocheir sinensis TaxID=95602 RepID=UPI0021C99FA7|nr:UBX domain-containing protein 1-B-like [Eriocheir sinensis]XP_050738236.1 UBX domain-containing protein 1-B-like [Eriocheir sinensis]XP_050738237.1 UBX domain-containing protein 1-B-like [Eriocheir sinensis]